MLQLVLENYTSDMMIHAEYTYSLDSLGLEEYQIQL